MEYFSSLLISVIYLSMIIIHGHCDSNLTNENEDYKLELVQVFFRHGDRTPDRYETYPMDPYKHSDYEPYGHGQLTNKGKRRAYRLGELLKNRYNEFLGEYKAGDVYAYSTALDRTKMSLQLVLASLYPPTPKLRWHKDLNWMPIPTRYNSPNMDHFFSIFICKRFRKLFEEVQQLPEVKAKLEKNKYFYEYLSNKTGNFPMKVELVALLSTTLVSQLSYGYPLPNWCTAEILEKIQDSFSLLCDLYLYTNSMMKIAVGPTLKSSLANMNRNVSRKIYLYSVHDLNLVFILRALNVKSSIKVNYGAAIVYEKLRGKDDQIYVRILFYPGHGEDFSVLKISTCEICLLSEYLKYIDSFLPSDEELECLTENVRSVGDSIDTNEDN